MILKNEVYFGVNEFWSLCRFSRRHIFHEFLKIPSKVGISIFPVQCIFGVSLDIHWDARFWFAPLEQENKQGSFQASSSQDLHRWRPSHSGAEALAIKAGLQGVFALVWRYLGGCHLGNVLASRAVFAISGSCVVLHFSQVVLSSIVFSFLGPAGNKAFKAAL